MGRSRYQFHENHYPYFITSSIVGGLPLFINPVVANIILDSLVYLQNNAGANLYAYVLMPDHFHLIAERDDLSDCLKKMKSFTARSIVDYLRGHNKIKTLQNLKKQKLIHHRDSEYQIWQEGLHPKQVFNIKMIRQKTDYIHFNPVNAGFVDSPLDWRYSSARNYNGNEGIIPVTIFSG